MHFAIDAGVCFLCVIVVGLILGIGWIWLLVASLVIGAAVAPLTHRAEERALADRAARRRALDSGS